MKRTVVCMSMIAVIIGACGGQDEIPYSEPHRTGAIPNLTRDTDESSYFISEHDAFHPNSLFESARKKTLTDFGYREQEPPVTTRTKNDVQQAIIDVGVYGLLVDAFKSTPFRQLQFPFDYENDIDRLHALARTHQLDTLFTDEMDELDRMVEVMDYTYRFMSGGAMPAADDDPGPSAELLTARRNEGIGGDARHYAALFCQLALSTGLNARLVGMHGIDEQGAVQSHMAAEVFLNQFHKWVLFDPFNEASYYIRNGKPLSALDIRNHMLNRNLRSVDVFSRDGEFTDMAQRKEALLERYRYLYLFRMNDILSNSPRNGSMLWEELYRTHLVFEGGRSLVSEGQFDRVPMFADGVRFVTRDPEEFNWDLNYVTYDLEVKTDAVITAYLNTVTPNFKDFYIKDEETYHSTNYSFRIMRVANMVTVASVNAFDIAGQPAIVDFSW